MLSTEDTSYKKEVMAKAAEVDLPKLPSEGEETEELLEVQVPGETKEQAFKRVVSKRVDNVVYNLRNISKTAGSSRYEYTEEDINKAFDYMQKALDKTRAAFSEEFMPPLVW